MKKIYYLLLCATTLLATVSCDDTTTSSPQEDGTNFIYTLNCGDWGSNNSTLSSYDIEDGSTVDCVVAGHNNISIGDTAQDILVLGNKMFITVSVSGVIFVTNLQGTILKTITSDTYFSPRYLTTDNDYVYVSFQDGAVGKIDPDIYTMTTVATTAPGNPEELDIVDGNLYVAISDYGYGNSESVVSVFSASTMTFTKNITVGDNPTILSADTKGNVYVVAMGDYAPGSVPRSLHKIDTATDTVTELTISGVDGAEPTAAVVGKDDILYVIEGVSNSSNNYKLEGSVYAYDATTGTASDFISDGTSISNMYSISSNTETGDIYVGTSDYWNTGDIYVIDSDGKVATPFSAGLNPMKSVVVTIAE